MFKRFAFVCIISVFGLLVGCQTVDPTAVPVAAADTATPQPSATPTHTPTPPNTPVPTATPTPTFTVTPTPRPLLTVFVQDAADETPLGASVVQLANDELGFHAEQTAVADGQSIFAGLTEGTTYTLTVKAEGFQDAVLTYDFTAGEEELIVALDAALFAIVATDEGSLYSGPGTVFDIVSSITEGDSFQVVGRNEAGDWLVVLTEEGDEAWLAAEWAEDLDISEMTAVAAPATPTPAPTVVAAAPPPPPAAPALPAGNLLTNGSFESGTVGWNQPGYLLQLRQYGATDHPQFVHSGTQSVVQVSGGSNSPYYFQHVQNITPGQTYRAGVWVKVWSSSGEDRTLSENPGDYAARLCINPLNESDPNKGTNVCTGYVRPLDAWQYISVEAVAETETIAVILQSAPIGPNLPLHNEAIFDDASLTTSTIAATPTPAPAGPPVRPAPGPFSGSALRDNMTNVEWVLNQMGGLLDRLIRGSWETCDEYQGYYRQVVESATYHSVPDEWNGVYNEYIFAVETTASRNEGVYSLCEGGGGSLNQHMYGDARSSIADSLNRLIPAIHSANALLGE